MQRTLIVALLALSLAFQSANAQTLTAVQRGSENSNGEGQNAGVGRSVMSANGRFLVFASTADNLVSNDDNGNRDIFVRNLATGSIQRVNVNQLGIAGDDDSQNPAVSAVAPNGFFVVAYESEAENLGWNRATYPDDNNRRDIYITLPSLNKITVRVSVGPNAAQANGNCDDPAIAIVPEPNRMFIAFSSTASNLVSDDTNGVRDIFLVTATSPLSDGSFDPATDLTTTRVSLAATQGDEADDDSDDPDISGDGRYVVFESSATNLVQGVTPTTRQVYLFDTVSQTTTLVSKSSSGAPGNGLSTAASINFRGNFIVYLTTSTNIFSDGQSVSTGIQQIARYNVKTGETDRVNVALDGTPGNGLIGSNQTASISPNGRFVVFSDRADNLVSNDSNSSSDIFFRDFGTSSTIRVSQSSSGAEGNDGSIFGTMGLQNHTSKTGFVSFISAADNLVSSDSEGFDDVFVSTVSIPDVPLTKETTIEVPPDVSAVSTKQISVSMEDFSGVDLNANSLTLPLIGGGSLGPPRGDYEVKSYRETDDGKKRELQKKFVKRNSVNFKGLKPGQTYVVQYRSRIKRKIKGTDNFKIVFRSNFSPAQRIKLDE